MSETNYRAKVNGVRRAAILRALRDNGGSVVRAAGALGISRQALYKAIRTLALGAEIAERLGTDAPRAYRVAAPQT